MKAPIAFDFDGTITLTNEYPRCERIRPGIADCICRLQREGHSIIIHTCRDTQTRESTQAYMMMVHYLHENGILNYVINTNVNPQRNFNPRKPWAVIYVDDCALGWNPDWTGQDIYEQIHLKLDSGHVNPVIFHSK